jgi:hypothetical protein
MKQLHRVVALSIISSLVIVSAAFAQLDTPSLSLGTSGHSKQTVFITAGPSGAPDGFTIRWMDQSTYLASGSHFDMETLSGEGVARFFGDPSLNTFGGQVSSFKLDPYETIRVEIGDLYDESGVMGDRTELDEGERYYFAAWANDSKGNPESNLSLVVSGFTSESFNCTFTLGYWKNHTDAWPVTSLKLGTVTYTQSQLLSILNQQPQGNGLVSLAHQLIAAKLNLAQGADPSAISATITAADAQIGGLIVPPIGTGTLTPGSTSAKTQVLDDFNNGLTGPGHCGAVPTAPASWGSVKARYR